MRKVWVFLLGMFVGGGLVFFSFKYHIVRTNNGVTVIAKKQAALSELYVDARSWRAVDWQSHPNLVQSIVASGRTDLIGEAGSQWVRELLNSGHAERVDPDLRLE